MAQNTVYQLDFDSNNSGYSLSLDDIAGETTDYFRRTDGSDIGADFSNVSGFYFAAQDIDGVGVTPIPSSTQTVTIPNINISGLDNLNFTIKIAEDDDGVNQDWDGADFFHVDYRIDGGAIQSLIWIEAETSGTNQLPRLDEDFDGIGEGIEVTDVFSEFSKAISGNGSTLELILTFKLDSGDEDIAIDDILVTSQNTAVNDSPSISNISQNPDSAVSSSDEVSISAVITDEDGLQSVVLDYDVAANDGSFDGSYDQSITMTNSSSTYMAIIPAQADGSNIYYQITATDLNSTPAVTSSAALSYQVRDPLPAPSLIITEVADPFDNANARFVEIYNNGSQPIDFDITPVYLARFANANTTSVDEQLIGVLGAGEYLVIAGSGTNYESAYGFSPDAISTGVSGNGDDTYALFSGSAGSGTLFDIYGAIGTDGTGEPWEYEDSRAVRNDLNVTPKTTWTASEWDIITANVNDMSPKRGEPDYVYAAGSWSPAAPEGLSTINDEIRVRDNVALTGDLEFRSLTVDENITFTVGANSITSSRNLFVNGTLDGQDGTLNFAGTLPQSTFGTGTLIIEDLIINNSGGVAFNNITNLEGILSLTNGELATNDLLTLKSFEGKAAVINEVVSGSISGNVTVEQFFPATTGRAFRFVSAPVNFDGSITANWQEGGSNAAGFGVQITGGDVAHGYDPSATNNPSLFRYDNGYTDPVSAWIPLSTANGDDLTSISPEAGDAYRLFIRGDRTTDLTSNTSAATATTLRATGTLVTGAYPATPIALAGPNLYSLIGNPYQSKVDVEQLLQNATNVVATEYYQWDSTTNNYVLYEFATPTTPMGSDISKNALPGQSFFVQSDATGNGSLQFQESYKTAGSDVATKNVDISNALTINLSTQEQIASGKANDIAIARFDEEFRTDFDPQDTQKFFGLSHSLAWEKNGAYYAVNRAAMPQDGDRFNLSVFVGTSGTYFFTVQSPEFEGLTTYFYDSLSDTYDLVTPGNPVVISKSIDLSNSSSTAGDRFQIVFRKSTLGMDDNFAFAKAISLFPNPSSDDAISISNLVAGKPVTFKIFNTLGQQVLTVEKTISGTIETINGLDNLANGLYLVNVYQNDLQTSIKLILN
ncbi:hypothetical protein AAU57_12470 [Nonlabens sp. YIK11]|nr:hypothetical protein AAU57_12470 [Nonlabens sp. YIK11]